MANNMRRGITAALIAAGIAVSAAGVANAGTHIGGGIWYHGVTDTTTYSNYYHDANCHGSTAVGTYTDRSGNTAAGRTSYASAPKAMINNQTYYRNSC